MLHACVRYDVVGLLRYRLILILALCSDVKLCESASGRILATAVSGSCCGPGWVRAPLASPVAIQVALP